MKSSLAHILLYITFVGSIFTLFQVIDKWYDKNVALQNNILIKEARTLYQDQINIREWNSIYGGIYVKPLKNQKANPYLKHNILKIDDDLTLLKINPAWMTRQLSELQEKSDKNSYNFRITGLNPINPKNAPNEFEKRALDNFTTTNKEYYEFTNSDTFKYMGALITKPSCLVCHTDDKYTLGEVSGGISIRLNSNQHHIIIESMKLKYTYAKILIFLFLTAITILLDKHLRSNQDLHDEVKKRTLEIESTKKLMQKILDADMSFLFLTDKTEVFFTNKTVLDFAGYATLEDFNLHFGDIGSKFEKIEGDDFLQANYGDVHWIDYLYEEQKHRNLRVLILHNGIKMYFKPHAKKINSDGKILYLISFDVITDEYEEIQALEEKASIDHLTGLLNRGKLDEILTQEMKLANTVNSSLSIIFLDIDHFKKVNDTLGHDIGDVVLIILSQLLTSTVRRGDLVARWGGEEFIIALQSTTKKEAGILAEKIRDKVQKHKFEQAGQITVSLGVTQFINGEDKKSLIRRVDEALYDAKDTGRNKVVIN